MKSPLSQCQRKGHAWDDAVIKLIPQSTRKERHTRCLDCPATRIEICSNDLTRLYSASYFYALTGVRR